MWVDIIAGTVLALVLGGAVAYIVIAKKKGKKCIGCPDSCSCSANQKEKCSGQCHSCPHSCAGCQSGTEKE
mgnify:CR=1 FL=1